METIHVFHDKLSTAHDPTLSAQFIAHLCLELIDTDRQIFVAFEILLHHLENGLFV